MNEGTYRLPALHIELLQPAEVGEDLPALLRRKIQGCQDDENEIS